eukprot:TRINITY_DN2486_c0_g1_i3.p1 TRINITY_DN2486_c0_g1~~TRINITY_DN2486_c0_g1_i3.p1  ORF type:complete len:226 (+),score=23.63 TRINITY_DN2486_c0_g1_i3:842-1519(+)
MDSLPNQEYIVKDLVEMGFDENLVRKAMKMTNDKERIVELILQFQEDNTILDTPPPLKLEEKVDRRMMRHKMVFLVRMDLSLNAGQIATQVGHAVLAAYKKAIEDKKYDQLETWGALGQAKVVLQVKDEAKLRGYHAKAAASNINAILLDTTLFTSLPEGQASICAIGPDAIDVVDSITGNLRLLPQSQSQIRDHKNKGDRVSTCNGRMQNQSQRNYHPYLALVF